MEKYKRKHNILIVDDEKLNIDLAAIYLNELDNVKLSFAQNGKQAIAGTQKKEIDLILLDINMPEIDGFEVCKILKADHKTKDIPIIFLTAQHGIDYVTKAFEVGGVDYINKPFNGEELKARVLTQLRLKEAMEELKDKQSRLAQLSVIDPLTKLNNLVFFQTKLKKLLSEKNEFWFLHFYIKDIQKMNYLFGFRVVDAILVEFSNFLRNYAYESDTVARLYGGHFALLTRRNRSSVESLILKFQNELKSSKKLSKISLLSVANLSKQNDTPNSLILRSHATLKKCSESTVLLNYLID